MLLLVLISVVPCLVGILNNYLLLRSIFASAVVSAAFLMFWLYLGYRSARKQHRYLPAVLATHTAGFVSFLLILWQFHVIDESNRNMAVCAISQFYSESILLIAARVSNTMNISTASVLPFHIISLVILVITYSCGFIWGKKQIRRNQDSIAIIGRE